MLGSAASLTLVTLFGLALGFAREWLLVSAWGAGAQSDAFLVALFLPEAVRMSLAGGLLSAAALPLYLAEDEVGRRRWMGALLPQLALIGLAVALLVLVTAPWIVGVIGLGLSDAGQVQAGDTLRLLAWCIPGFVLHALLSVPLQASERFVMAGLGSVLFNAPPVIYLASMGTQSSVSGVAEACVLGSVLMAGSLLPWQWKQGWRPWRSNGSLQALRLLGQRMLPLVGSNAASQGLALLERSVASLLGEGAVTWVNLARKLVNLPLVALMSLNQVLLGLMSSRADTQRIPLLRRGSRRQACSRCRPASAWWAPPLRWWHCCCRHRWGLIRYRRCLPGLPCRWCSVVGMPCSPVMPIQPATRFSRCTANFWAAASTRCCCWRCPGGWGWPVYRWQPWQACWSRP